MTLFDCMELVTYKVDINTKVWYLNFHEMIVLDETISVSGSTPLNSQTSLMFDLAAYLTIEINALRRSTPWE